MHKWQALSKSAQKALLQNKGIKIIENKIKNFRKKWTDRKSNF